MTCDVREVKKSGTDLPVDTFFSHLLNPMLQAAVQGCADEAISKIFLGRSRGRVHNWWKKNQQWEIVMTKTYVDPNLLRALEAAARIPVSAQQLTRQRIEYIAAELTDEDTRVTVEQVESALSRLGAVAA